MLIRIQEERIPKKKSHSIKIELYTLVICQQLIRSNKLKLYRSQSNIIVKHTIKQPQINETKNCFVDIKIRNVISRQVKSGKLIKIIIVHRLVLFTVPMRCIVSLTLLHNYTHYFIIEPIIMLVGLNCERIFIVKAILCPTPQLFDIHWSCANGINPPCLRVLKKSSSVKWILLVQLNEWLYSQALVNVCVLVNA